MTWIRFVRTSASSLILPTIKRVLREDRACLRHPRPAARAECTPRTRRIRPGCGVSIALLENILQHVDHLLRVGTLEFDELARHFRRGDVDLLDHPHQLAQDVGALRDEQAG